MSRARRHVLSSPALFLSVSVIGAALGGCGGSEEPSPSPEPTAPTATPTAAPTPTPTAQPKVCAEGQRELDGVCVADLPDGWTQVFPGGDTICARGTEFSYFVHPGTVNKLVLGLDGGGACWDYVSCSKANPTFTEAVTESDNPENLTEGLLDMTNPENPFVDWFMVFIPYCTGDIHWGDNVATYDDGSGNTIEVHHKGFVNAMAVLDWSVDHFEQPESIFLTGVSAGSYGSIGFAPHVQTAFPDSKVIQVGDCGAGVVTQDFLATGITNWDAQKNFPFEEISEADLQTLTLNDVYLTVSKYYPDMVISQYNTAFDENQLYYYLLMGGDGTTWSATMFANMELIAAGAPNFRYYVAGGDLHGILPYNEFYTYTVGDVRVRDWVTDLVLNGDADNVVCESCEEPELYTP